MAKIIDLEGFNSRYKFTSDNDDGLKSIVVTKEEVKEFLSDFFDTEIGIYSDKVITKAKVKLDELLDKKMDGIKKELLERIDNKIIDLYMKIISETSNSKLTNKLNIISND